jgi:drug/metabolite transporter (DMT)-like permease
MLIVVALALGAAVVYGGSDFLGAFAARRINLVRATMFNYAVAAVVILIALPILGGAWSSAAAWAGITTGLLAVFGLLAFYGVMAIGPMSLLSPLIALIQSIVPVTFAALTGQGLSPIAWVAVALAVVAIILISPRPQPGREHISPRGAVLAIASGLLLGGSLITLDAAPRDSGVVPAVWEIIVGLVVLIIAWLAIRRSRMRTGALSFLEPSEEAVRTLSGRAAWIATLTSGLLTGVADALIVYALHVGNLAVVSVLLALYPVTTVILAAVVLRERMTKLQLVGIFLVIGASLLLSAT